MDLVSVNVGQKTETLVNIAIELYKEDVISISKAYEMADVTTIEFKEIFGKLGIIREIEARSGVEMDRKLKKYL